VLNWNDKLCADQLVFQIVRRERPKAWRGTAWLGPEGHGTATRYFVTLGETVAVIAEPA
jgi:hypothetical protein